MIREYYVRQMLGEDWGVIESMRSDNDRLICRCGFERDAIKIVAALNARESLARALGVTLDG
jgi:hypothetical protein